jgi:hypothetical protein
MRVNIGDVMECFKANDTALNRDLRIKPMFFPSEYIFLFSEFSKSKLAVLDITINKKENWITIFKDRKPASSRSILYFEKNFKEEYPNAFLKLQNWLRLEKLSRFASND